MRSTLSRRFLIPLLVGGLCARAPLGAQTAQVRAKVSPLILPYVPASEVQGELEIPGTDALSDLGEEWNRAYRNFQPEARLLYTPKLTKEAVADLVAGRKALIITARELTGDETEKFKAAYGYQPMRIPVSMDATIVFVNKSNPITQITMEELDAIYSSTRLGGRKEPAVTWGDLKVKGDLAKRTINAYARGEGAATRDAFRTAVLRQGTYRPGIIDRNDASALAEAILIDQTGIAFSTLASWYTANKVLPVVPYNATDARFPTQENVNSSRYPMPRLYYAYVNRAPGKPLEPAVNEALHFLLSREGQDTVAEVGLLPGPAEFLAIALKRLDR
jgi:phosphate transport system substrate-binding protein